MARGKNTRKNDGTLTVYLNSKRSTTDEQERRAARDGGAVPKGQPHYRGDLKIGTQEFEISLWVKTKVPATAAPMRLTGEVTLKPE